MARRQSPKTDKSEAPMSKKSSAALAEAGSASSSRVSTRARALVDDDAPPVSREAPPDEDFALDTLEKDLPKEEEAIELPQLPELRKFCKLYKKQRNKLTREQEKKYRALCESLARAIRLADSDRLWIAHAEEIVRKLGE